MRYVFGFMCVLALGVMGCSETSGAGGEGGSGGTAGGGGTGGADLCEGVDCDDANECTDDACADGECSNTAVADNTECDWNGLPGLCMSGVCENALLCVGVDCDDDNDCTWDECNWFDGSCFNPSVEDGADCSLGDLPGVCASGACQGLCEDASCDHTECAFNGTCNSNDGACDYTFFADDGTLCSEGECLDGVCAPVGAFPCTEQGIRDAIAEGGGPHFFACDGRPTVVTEGILIDNDVILDGQSSLVLETDGSNMVLSVAAGVAAEVVRFTIRGSNGYCPIPPPGGCVSAIDNEGTLVLTESVVTRHGVSPAIFNQGVMRITDSTVSENLGAALYSFNGDVTVVRSTLSDNGYSPDYGSVTNGGTMRFVDSTLSGNIGSISNSGTMQFVDSTLSGDRIQCWRGTVELARSTVLGGSLSAVGCTFTLTNCTVFSLLNSGVYPHGPATFVLSHVTFQGSVRNGFGNAITVISSNSIFSPVWCQEWVEPLHKWVAAGCDGLVTSLGYNVSTKGLIWGFDQPTDQINVSADDLKRERLADNGGPTETSALLPGSVAIDVIPAEDCLDADGAPLTTDQRGEPRPGDSICDVGAFEVQP